MKQVEKAPLKRSKKLVHHIHPIIEQELKLEWSMLDVHGIGTSK